MRLRVKDKARSITQMPTVPKCLTRLMKQKMRLSKMELQSNSQLTWNLRPWKRRTKLMSSFLKKMQQLLSMSPSQPMLWMCVIQYLMVHQVSWMCRLMVQALVILICHLTQHGSTLKVTTNMIKSLMDQVHASVLMRHVFSSRTSNWNLVIRFLWLRGKMTMSLMVLILLS